MREAGVRRLLMTGDTVGGVWTFTLDLAEALGIHGVEVVLATFGRLPSAEQQAQASRIPNLSLMPSVFRLEWMQDPWDDVEESGRWLALLAEEYRPDAIHLNSFGHGSVAFNRPVVLTAHSCVLSWWDAVKGGRAPSEWDRYKVAVKTAIRSADLVTAPSRSMAAALGEQYGFTGCEVIHNGRNASLYRSAFKEPFVFTAGRLWDEAKNAAALMRIAPKLSWPVYAAGEGGSLGRLSAEAMAEWFSRASIYALPAKYEPFGLSVLEAGLSECALVLGDIDSLREIWGDTALFVAPDDSEALRLEIQTLIANEALRADLARRSYARALTYRVDVMARRYLECYQLVGARAQCAS